MDWDKTGKKVLISSISGLALIAGITWTGVCYNDCSSRRPEEDLPPLITNLTPEMDFVTNPITPAETDNRVDESQEDDAGQEDIFASGDLGTITAEAWEAGCNDLSIFNPAGCKSFSKIFSQAKIRPEAVSGFFEEGVNDPVQILKLNKSHVDLDLYRRCKNTGIGPEDCMVYGEENTSPSHYERCKRDHVTDDPYTCLIIRRTESSAQRVNEFKALFETDQQLNECPTSPEDTRSQRQKNRAAMISYLTAPGLPEKMSESAILPPRTEKMSASEALSFHKICIDPYAAANFHSSGVPASYVKSINDTGILVGSGSTELSAAYYSCISADDVNASIDRGAKRLSEVILEHDSKRDPRRVRDELRKLGRYDCPPALAAASSEVSSDAGLTPEPTPEAGAMPDPVLPNPFATDNPYER